MIKLNKTKLKYITDFLPGFGFPDELQGTNEGEIPFLKVSDINGDEREVEVANNYVSKKLALSKSWRLVPPRSILMAKIGAALSKNHRKINKISVIIDNNMMAAVPKKINYSFHYWLWRTIDLKDFQNISSVPSVDMTTLKDLFIQLPDQIQQKQIAYYLDHKIAKIDEAIAKKNQLINLLEEKCMSTIRNALYYKNVQKRKLKFIATMKYGDALANEIRNAVGNIPVFGSFGQVGLHDIANTSSPVLVIGRKGSYGKVVFSKVPVFVIDTAYYIDSKNSKCNLRWLFYVLQNIDFEGSSLDTGVPGLSRVFANNCEIPYCDITKQAEIATSLDSKMELIRNTIETIQKSVNLIEEYKISLISNAVTGRVKI